MRRLLGLPFVLVLLTLAPVPAGAATVCTVNVPASVSATAAYTWVHPTFTGCDGYAQASWNVTRGDHTYGRVTVKNGVSQGSWIYRDTWPTGTYTLTGTSAAVPQNSIKTVVKYGSRISLRSTRVSDLKVPLSGIVTYYSPSAHAFRRWANRSITVSYRNCTTCEWHFLATDRTDAQGVYSLGAVSYEARYYRARVGSTTTVWGRTSAATYN